ncbi:hypothetical protein Tco_0887347 [Tanacetum coccineum]
MVQSKKNYRPLPKPQVVLDLQQVSTVPAVLPTMSAVYSSVSVSPQAMPVERGGKQTSGLSALRLVEGRSKGGDGVGNSIGRSGGVPDGGVSDQDAKM